MFNMPTDIMLWKSVTESRLDQTKLEMERVGRSIKKVNGDADTGTVVVDAIELKLQAMGYSHPGTELLKDVTLSVPQGKLVAVIGPHGSGKNTLLRLIGHTMCPQEGKICIPTHLNILHVCHEPVLLQASIWGNLTLGRHNASKARVLKIVERLKMKNTARFLKVELKIKRELAQKHKNSQSAADEFQRVITDYENTGADLDEEDDKHEVAFSWIAKLSYGERAKLHLARAFIMNPEVLVLQRPLSHFDHEVSRLV